MGSRYPRGRTRLGDSLPSHSRKFVLTALRRVASPFAHGLQICFMGM